MNLKHSPLVSHSGTDLTKKNKELDELTTHLTNQSGHQNSLPIQDYHNVTRRKDEVARKRHLDRSVQGLNSPAEQS